jgi:hypothetical protein
MLTAGVRNAALLSGQPPDVLRRIRREFDRLVEPYATEAGLEVPVAVRLGAATRTA